MTFLIFGQAVSLHAGSGGPMTRSPGWPGSNLILPPYDDGTASEEDPDVVTQFCQSDTNLPAPPRVRTTSTGLPCSPAQDPSGRWTASCQSQRVQKEGSSATPGWSLRRLAPSPAARDEHDAPPCSEYASATRGGALVLAQQAGLNTAAEPGLRTSGGWSINR
ncbi:MAG: hypothetical protein R3F43_15860 [bacterium]